MTFEEDPDFTEKALRLIGEDGVFAIQMYLMEQPDAGDIIPGSGGSPQTPLGRQGPREAGRRTRHLLLDHRRSPNPTTRPLHQE